MKILLVDDEPQALQDVSETIENEVQEWKVEMATSGCQALNMLDSGKFDVLVSDLQAPGMDGDQWLESVGEQHPSLLRVVLTGQADRETVLQAIRPMHQFLSKPCEPSKLIEKIRRAEIFQETITSTEVLNAIGQANCLPSLPSIVTELDQELESDSSTSTSLAGILEQDPSLCAKVLQLANSPIFGLRQPVVDLNHGLSVLGSELIRALALSSAVFKPTDKSTTRFVNQMFEHSLEVAGICRSIASWEKTVTTEAHAVFTGGLLHDVGKVLLMNAFPEEYSLLLKKARALNKSIVELEMEEFGASHPGIGAYLLETWGLPTLVIEMVAMHHSLFACSRSANACQIVFGANWLSHGANHQELQTPDDESAVQEFKAKLRFWNYKNQEQEEF